MTSKREKELLRLMYERELIIREAKKECQEIRRQLNEIQGKPKTKVKERKKWNPRRNENE